MGGLTLGANAVAKFCLEVDGHVTFNFIPIPIVFANFPAPRTYGYQFSQPLHLRLLGRFELELSLISCRRINAATDVSSKLTR